MTTPRRRDERRIALGWAAVGFCARLDEPSDQVDVAFVCRHSERRSAFATIQTDGTFGDSIMVNGRASLSRERTKTWSVRHAIDNP